MLTQIKRWLDPPDFGDEEKNRIANLLSISLLSTICTLLPMMILFYMIDIPLTARQLGISCALAGIFLCLLMRLVLQMGYITAASLAFLVIAWSLVATAAWFSGIHSTSYSVFVLVIILAGLLYKPGSSFIIAVISFTYGIILYWLELQGMATDLATYETAGGVLASSSVIFILSAIITYLSQRSYQNLVERLHHNEQDLLNSNRNLQAIQTSLEDRVAERTKGLEMIASLSEHLNAILDLDQLLTELVTQIKETFVYDHVHIYWLDEDGQSLVLAAGAGQVGAELKAQKYHIALDAESSVMTQATQSRQIVRVNNVRQNPRWLPNPLLPDTISEIAIPILLEGKVQGVLDIQSHEIDRFTQDDVYLLRLLTSQLTVALNNARLFTQTQAALAEVQAVHQRYQTKSWQDYRRTSPVLQAKARQSAGEMAVRASEDERLERLKREAIQQATLIQHDASAQSNGSDPASTLATMITPLKLGNQVVGTLGVRDKGPNRGWTEDEIAFVEAIAQQVVQALDNARLFDEIQKRAAREQLTREITDKMRALPDVEKIVQTGLAELTKALGISRSYVKLTAETEAASLPENTLPDK